MGGWVDLDMSEYINLTKKQKSDINWILSKINDYLNNINDGLYDLCNIEYPDNDETPVIFIYDEEFINSYSNILQRDWELKTASYEVKLIDMQYDLEQMLIDNQATKKDLFFYSFIIKEAQIASEK